MTRDKYKLFLRMLACLGAVIMWAYSVTFSANGFNFQAEDQYTAGILLAICVTIVELVWNKEGMNASLTILVSGIIAYLYGVVTNVVGLAVYRGALDFMENPFAYGIPVVAGLLLEILPEPLLVWGLLGESWGGDFLTNLFGNVPKMSKPAGKTGYPTSNTFSIPTRGGNNPYRQE